MRFDLLIKYGELIDPVANVHGKFDIAIRRGRIAAVDRDIPVDSAWDMLDASGLVVTPGLIDLHTHAYRGGTYWGVDADAVASRTGVTTWVDAGSAGALNFDGFREFILQRSRVRILALLNISYIGLVGHDYELANLAYCDTEIFRRTVARNPDVIVGAKVRMGSPTVGENGLEPMRRALQAADQCDLPLMVHMAPAPPPGVDDVVGAMRPGDILTHCFNGLATRLVDDEGKPHPFVTAARDRGVVMDIGHGAGSFSFDVAESLLERGFAPDVISTDIHQLSIYGPMFDMPTCLSKFLALGVPLPDVIAACTARPAEVLGMGGEIGSLRPGAAADVALLAVQKGSFELFDIQGAMRESSQLIRCVATIAAGRMLPLASPAAPPVWVDPVWPAHQAALTSKQVEFWEAGYDPDALAASVGDNTLRRVDMMDDARRRLHGYRTLDRFPAASGSAD